MIKGDHVKIKRPDAIFIGGIIEKIISMSNGDPSYGVLVTINEEEPKSVPYRWIFLQSELILSNT